MSEPPPLVPDQWPPRSCGMPALRIDPGENYATLVLNVTLAGGLPPKRVAASFAKNFVRLTEAALRNYIDAQRDFSQLFERDLSPAFVLPQVVSYLEQCILCLRRTLRYANHQDGVRLPKRTVTSRRVRKLVTEMRDAIEHTDARLVTGQIGSGEPIMLKPKSDRIELSGVTILYTELSEWLVELNELAGTVAAWNQKQTPGQ